MKLRFSKKGFWWTAGILELLWLLMFVASAWLLTGFGALQGPVSDAFQNRALREALGAPFTHFVSMFSINHGSVDAFLAVLAMVFWTGILIVAAISFAIGGMVGTAQKK